MGITLLSQNRISLSAVSAVAVLLGAAAGVGVPGAHATRVAPQRLLVVARAARNLSIHETATMRPVGNLKGHILNERGTLSGTYRGSIEARLVTVTNTRGEATLTAYTSGGSLKATATTRSRPEKTEEAIGHFYGTASITGGTGRWAHASGRLIFNGTVDRQNLHARAVMSGTLHV